MPTVYEKFSGCLWGGAVGDALGAPVEFLPHTTQIVTDYSEFGDGSGSISDDTQMTIFTLEAMLFLSRSSHIIDIDSYFRRSYGRWLMTQRYSYDKRALDKWLFPQEELWHQRAPGATCLNALPKGIGDNDSKGCGGVMRIAPCGLLKVKDKSPFSLGMAAAKITHGHPTGYITAGFLAQVISDIVFENFELPSAIQSACLEAKVWSDCQETLDAVNQAVDMYYHNVPCILENIAKLGEGWVAEEALAISLFCALSYQNDFRAGVLAAVNITGDRDSTGAIAGNILGALNGVNAIPESWRNHLKERNVIKSATDYIAALYK